MNIETRERAIYLGAFMLLAVNRLLARRPAAIFPASVIEDPDHVAWLWMQGFMIVAIAFAIYGTWRIFRYARFSAAVSLVNGLIAPFFWPFVMLPQAIVVFRRLSKLRSGSKRDPIGERTGHERDSAG